MKIKDIINENIFLKNANTPYYGTSVLHYGDIDYLKILWELPIDKVKDLIQLISQDLKTSKEMASDPGVLRKLYIKHQLIYKERLKWAKEVLSQRKNNKSRPDFLK